MHPNKGSRAACFAGALTAALLFSAAASSQPPLRRTGRPGRSSPPSRRPTRCARRSAARVRADAAATCLAINDEKSYAQFFAIKGRKIVPHRLIRLVPDGAEPGELDIEAVAYDRGFFYVTGSHGAPRNPGAAIDPSRFFIFRFRVNERTGKPRFRFGDEVVDTTAIVKTNALREVIKATEEIGPICGKAARPERRQHRRHRRQGRQDLPRPSRPSVDGRAFILAVNTNAVFGNEAMKEKVHPICLGPRPASATSPCCERRRECSCSQARRRHRRLFGALLGRAVDRDEAARESRRRAGRRQARDLAGPQRKQRKILSRAGADREHRQRQSAGISDPALTMFLLSILRCETLLSYFWFSENKILGLCSSAA